MDLTPLTAALLVGIGLAVGVASGLVGIGGGVLVIPILMLAFGFSQARANGTSLAMLLPPIGVFAVLAYARAGNVDWRVAGLMALGFAAGAYAGARLLNAGLIHPTAVRVAFAVLLLYCAGRILFRSGGRATAALETTGLIVAFVGTYLVMRLLGRRWGREGERRRRPPPDWGAIYRAKVREPQSFDYEI
jgi:uncharacterized membrane protein YfcA